MATTHRKCALQKEGAKKTIGELQEHLARIPELLTSSFDRPHVVLCVPSMSFPREILNTVEGLELYEERLLCSLRLLQNPHAHVIFVSSMAVEPRVINYYAEAFMGEHHLHSFAARFHQVVVGGRKGHLTYRLLKFKSVLNELRAILDRFEYKYMACYAASYREEQLARELQIPLFASRARLRCGTKSYSRKLFARLGIPHPRGFEELKTSRSVFLALSRLYMGNPSLAEAVVKMDVGVSGKSNARIHFDKIHMPPKMLQRGLNKVANYLQTILLDPKASAEYVTLPSHIKTLSYFLTQFVELGGGVVEEWMPNVISSPSVQFSIPLQGKTEILATHNQMLRDGVFLGSFFPAHKPVRKPLHDFARCMSPAIRRDGGLGYISADFVQTLSAKGTAPALFAVELNIRRGGTAHPLENVKGVTGARYSVRKGCLVDDHGPIFYHSSDNILLKKGMHVSVDDVISLVEDHNFAWNGTEGIVLHLFSTLECEGKIGGTFIGRTPMATMKLYSKFVALLYEIAVQS